MAGYHITVKMGGLKQKYKYSRDDSRDKAYKQNRKSRIIKNRNLNLRLNHENILWKFVLHCNYKFEIKKA